MGRWPAGPSPQPRFMGECNDWYGFMTLGYPNCGAWLFR